MSEIIQPGAGILFMKIGTHANEDLASIIDRKAREIEEAGVAMWGYGGSTCHPSTMVQPFAKSFAEQGRPIHLVMESMNSQHYAETKAAKEYSIDGITWKPIHDKINVLGSRYALVINKLREEKFDLALDQTTIPLGRSMGKVGSNYIKGRVDKACLAVADAPVLTNEQVPTRPISLVAELAEPYAVFLRDYRD